MFNYAALDDTEFENLCKDVMERKLGTSLRVFSRGRDGGIDIRNSTGGNKIVIQVKHYIQSQQSTVLSSLKKERKNLEKLQPTDYYICISKEMTPQNIDKIYALFATYMSSPQNIITIKEIDHFLKQAENADIVKKNVKLWLASSHLIKEELTSDISEDTAVLIEELKEQLQYFVQTCHYNRCLELLTKQHAVMITGEPGVGKSLLSKMLAFYYVNEGYQLKFVSNQDLAALKKSLSQNKQVKEVILLDDCLGQNYFNLREFKQEELMSLIRSCNSNRKIILNTRMTILNEAKAHSVAFQDFIESQKIAIEKMNIQQLSLKEKAEIFYLHLKYNQIPAAYYQNIQEHQQFRKIVTHPNFSPRIMEFVSKKYHYETVSSLQYSAYILTQLTHPKDIWENEFKNRISDEDRLLLLVLFSMTKNQVRSRDLSQAFYARLKKEQGADLSIDRYHDILGRLQNSFIQLTTIRNETYIGVINPSINDYLKTIYHRGNERENILETAIFFEQIERSCSEEELNAYVIKAFANQSIYTMDALSKEKLVTFIIEKGMILEMFTTEYVTYCIENIAYYRGDTQLIETIVVKIATQFPETLPAIFTEAFIQDSLIGTALPEMIAFINTYHQLAEHHAYSKQWVALKPLIEQLLQVGVDSFYSEHQLYHHPAIAEFLLEYQQGTVNQKMIAYIQEQTNQELWTLLLKLDPSYHAYFDQLQLTEIVDEEMLYDIWQEEKRQESHLEKWLEEEENDSLMKTCQFDEVDLIFSKE